MQKFKEFQGKDLDECIQQALSYYDAPREKLEIEIVQDAKSGIFGIVGARKAKIRARRASIADTVQTILATGEGRPPRQEAREKHEKKSGEAQHKNSGQEPHHQKSAHKNSHEQARQAGDRKQQPATRPEPVAEAPFEDAHVDDLEDACPGLHLKPLEELDQQKLAEVTKDVVETLVKPVAGRDVSVSVRQGDGRICARVEWQGDAGLLIGRERQTLAAIQYLASRIISRHMDAIVRVQLDIGEYRSRQDEKLRELAFSLADRARESGKPCSTRPLSSYHRRIIHLSLQDVQDVQTRSSGEGPLKRVIIAPKRNH